MPPGLPGGKRIIAGPLLAKKTGTSVGNSDIRKLPAYFYEILLKSGYEVR